MNRIPVLGQEFPEILWPVRSSVVPAQGVRVAYGKHSKFAWRLLPSQIDTSVALGIEDVVRGLGPPEHIQVEHEVLVGQRVMVAPVTRRHGRDLEGAVLEAREPESTLAHTQCDNDCSER